MNKTLRDLANTRLPQVLGHCAGDLSAIASYVNEATSELLNKFSDTGFWGGWAKGVFNVHRDNPFITLDPQFARAVNLDACRTPWRIRNAYYELLEDGVGLQNICPIACNGTRGAYDREQFPTQVDLTPANKFLRLYLTDARDIGKRVLFSNAIDQNGNGIYTQDGINRVMGFYLALNSPFVTSTFIVTQFSQIVKDVTYGDVVLMEVDATTGAETLLSRYTPQETTPGYRRYFLQSLPCSCCPNPDATETQVQVTAMLKYSFRPVLQPDDLLMTSNIAGLKHAVEAVRFSEMDSPNAQQMSLLKWQQAVKSFSDELGHFLGPNEPAVTVSLDYASGLRGARVGMM